MSKGVAITGMGIISAIGNNVSENYHALIHQQTGIDHIDHIDTVHKGTIKVGEIKLSNAALIEQLGLPLDNNFNRSGLLGVIAAKEACESAQISDINAYKTGLISATSVGGMDMTERYFYEFENDEKFIKYIESHSAGDLAQKIAQQIGLKGFVTTISTACSSSANAIMLGARMIKSGQLDRVIVGGTDALSKFTINGFNSLMILTDRLNTPFDQHRKGLNLGEAAAYLVLESDELVEKEGKNVLGYVAGYGNANDAFHQTASSENGEGNFLAMNKALKVARLLPEQIDYINAHGTATPNNDLSEGRSILRIFGDKAPLFSSTKPYTGHTLAAAAAVEAVFSILALQHQIVYPNLNFSTPMEEFELIPQTTLVNHTLQHVLSNSFGFGGNCSTVIFSK